MHRAIIVALSIGATAFAPAVGHAQTDTVTYYHTDAIGSVRMVTNEAAQVVARYDYQPFGLALDQVPPPPVEQRQFAGKERDAETEFDYFGARYYASGNGRFTTVDPLLDIEEAVSNPQQWNRYTYVQNNPFRYVDPDGRQAWVTWVHNALNSPTAQRAGQALMTQAANLTIVAMRVLGSPATPELAQAMVEVATGAELPGGLPATGAARLLPSEVAENFTGNVHRFVAKSDLTAFRYWTPGSRSIELGPWLTTGSTVSKIGSSDDAIRALNLNPSGNLATALSKIVIPKGTEVFVGRVKSGSSWATQVWTRDRDRLRLLGQVVDEP